MRPWYTLAGLIQRTIAVYRRLAPGRLGGRCRFRPTCSAYAMEAFGSHGAARGGWLTIKRLGKCHPLYGKSFQFDPVPERRA